MVTSIKKAKGSSEISKGIPRSLQVAKDGISSSQDMSNCMSLLMSDLIEGSISPQIANAVCNCAGKLLKTVEMQHKYGTTVSGGNAKTLLLASHNGSDSDPDGGGVARTQ